MKTYTKIRNKLLILFTVIMLFGISSCSDKLNLYPNDQFATETFWTNETNAKIALTGVYTGNIKYASQVDPTDWWTYAGLVFFDQATDISRRKVGLQKGTD